MALTVPVKSLKKSCDATMRDRVELRDILIRRFFQSREPLVVRRAAFRENTASTRGWSCQVQVMPEKHYEDLKEAKTTIFGWRRQVCLRIVHKNFIWTGGKIILPLNCKK